MGLLTPEEAIRTAALADETVSGLLSVAIFPAQAQASTDAPFVVYSRVSSNYEDFIDDVDSEKAGSCNVQYDIFGSGYDDTRAVADALRSALNGYSGTVTSGSNSLAVNRIRLTNENDGFDNPDNGRGAGTFRIMQEYEIWFKET